MHGLHVGEATMTQPKTNWWIGIQPEFTAYGWFHYSKTMYVLYMDWRPIAYVHALSNRIFAEYRDHGSTRLVKSTPIKFSNVDEAMAWCVTCCRLSGWEF